MIRNRLKSQIVFMLLLLSILLWSKIFLKIKAEFDNRSKSSEKPKTIFQATATDSGSRFIDLYLLDSLEKIQDPFSYNFGKEKLQDQKSDSTRKKSNTDSDTPFFKYSGLLSDKDGKVALIEISPNDIQFVREGQTIQGFELIKILSKQVRFKNKDKEFSISANF
ncbi:MAG: hypothetical protein A2Y94_13670 [Caldithrix sp. RBG_13_44_9]|nr:MAG: hypothetical protein A2Y94_13670 [Caldithrix sp. RBG_13_44_9]